MSAPPHPNPSPIRAAQRRALWRAEGRETLRLAVALASTNLLQMAVYAVDVMFVARLSQRALATSSLAVAVFSLMAWSLFSLMGAAAALMAAELGRRTHAVREIRRSVRMALWASVGLGAVAMLICDQGEAIFRALGQKPEIATLAGGFLGWLKWAVIPMLAAAVLRNFVATLGRPAFATAITAASIAVNAGGNYALVFGHWGAPALGLNGSAIANVLTALATLAAYVLVVSTDRRFARYRLFGRWWRADWERLGQIMALGTPIALTTLAEAGLFNAAAFLMGRLGEAELAAHTLAMQMASFAFMLPFGIGQAATIRVGYHYGARDKAGVARAGGCALAVGLGFALASAGAMVLAPRLLLSDYVDVAAPEQAHMVILAVQYMAVAAAFQLCDGTQAILSGALRGLQDTRLPMAIAMFGYWLPGFGTAIWLGFGTRLGGLGVWLGLACGLVVVSGLLAWRWARREALGLVAFR